MGKKSQIHIIENTRRDRSCHAELAGEGTMTGPVDAEGKGIRAGEEALLSAALEGVHDLNERCMVLLQKLAVAHPGDLPQFLGPLIPQLRKLDRGAICAIADHPFLLMDFVFGKPKWLHEVLTNVPSRLHFPNPRSTFPAADAKALVRGALLLAKSVCRHHPAHAALLLGLDPSLQPLMAELRLPDLEGVAEAHPHQLRLRWENRFDVWEYLLAAGTSPDPGACHQFRMYGMQLIAGDLKRGSSGVR
jgi:diadenosine tetraphosphatase ApaH/serine/threonine PP2A family protein phosphatase